MTARPVNRPHCQRPGACRAKGGGHCPKCHHMSVLWKAGIEAGKRGSLNGAEAKRAKKVPITLAPVRIQFPSR